MSPQWQTNSCYNKKSTPERPRNNTFIRQLILIHSWAMLSEIVWCPVLFLMATPSFRQFHPRQLKQHSWLLHLCYIFPLHPTNLVSFVLQGHWTLNGNGLILPRTLSTNSKFYTMHLSMTITAFVFQPCAFLFSPDKVKLLLPRPGSDILQQNTVETDTAEIQYEMLQHRRVKGALSVQALRFSLFSSCIKPNDVEVMQSQLRSEDERVPNKCE